MSPRLLHESPVDPPLFTTQAAISWPDIAAPYDFGFQLRHYVIALEVREAQKLVEIIRLSSGDLVKVDLESRGTVDVPRIGYATRANLAVAFGDPFVAGGRVYHGAPTLSNSPPPHWRRFEPPGSATGSAT
jgi:hypothetical protein